ncbi:GNAT family N-acetyltransferase [Geothrix terrae]|uniref:GNAT family N-acetyltransferase n=1 Tax=Geothrix terrae TaxID=2922720 RepID=UPI001FADFDD5|nr:GNAT family N-acetyltransferase [Geothrix terrae]
MHGIWWGHHRGPFYTSLPFQLKADVGPDEAREILSRARIPGLCFPSDRPGLPAGHYVIRPEGYGLAAVNRKQRGHVTRGLEACELRTLGADELLHQGMPLNRETLSRQAREDATFLDPVRWKAFVQAVGRCPGMTVHGAFVEGRLATYLISCRDGQWLHLIYKMSSRTGQEHHPNHALDFAIIRDAAADPGIRFIGNGMTSILPNEGLDRYKRQLGYQVEPHNLSIHFHPWLAPALSTAGAIAVLRRAQTLLPGGSRLAYYTTVLEGALTSRAGLTRR